jgi:hypothetical protein
MKKIIILILIIFLLTIPFFGQEKHKIEKMESGEIDWTTLVIKAVGIGAPNPNLPQRAQRPAAKRAAKEDAKRNLLEIIQGVHVSSETTVENFMLKDDVIKTKVEGVLRGFKEDKVKYMSDGTIEVVLKIAITGELVEIMLPLYTDGVYNKDIPRIGEEEAKDKMYTGIIVDATDFNILPCMAPKIYSENGQLIYDASYVDSDYAIENGVVGYSKDVEMAKENNRVGDNPYIVKAVKSGEQNRDVYISKKASKTITNN